MVCQHFDSLLQKYNQRADIICIDLFRAAIDFSFAHSLITFSVCKSHKKYATANEVKIYKQFSV